MALVKNLSHNQALFKDEDVIAFFATEGEEVMDFSAFEAIDFEGDIIKIEHTWDIFSKNGEAIEEDFKFITKNRNSAKSRGVKRPIYGGSASAIKLPSGRNQVATTHIQRN